MTCYWFSKSSNLLIFPDILPGGKIIVQPQVLIYVPEIYKLMILDDVLVDFRTPNSIQVGSGFDASVYGEGRHIM